MSDMPTLVECLELEFILLKTPQKATNMFMGLEEEQAVPHTKTGHVIYVTGEHPAFSVMTSTLHQKHLSLRLYRGHRFSSVLLSNKSVGLRGWVEMAELVLVVKNRYMATSPQL